MNIKIISRKEAISQELKRYFTGEPCKHGHIDYRRTKNGTCVSCEKNLKKKNKHLYSKTNKEWIQKNKDKYSRNKHEWYLKNKDVYKKRLADYPEKYLEASRKWRKENRQDFLTSVRKSNYKRRSILKNSKTNFTTEQIFYLLQLQKYKCVNCRCCLKKNKKHLDHIIPLALGGENDISNLQWLCQKCNLSKSAKEPIAWAQSQGRLL